MEHRKCKTSNKHLKTGQIGENLAVEYLKKEGFKILDRNYWRPYGEIDIVAKKGDTIHLVEVKTVSGDVNRGTNDYYEPEDNVHLWKRQRLARVIQTYLGEANREEELDWQMDLASVYVSRETGELLKIEFLEDIILS